VNKRNIVLIIALLAFLAAALYMLSRRSTPSGFSDPYRAIPGDACLVLESPDLPGFLNKLSGQSGLFRELGDVKELVQFYNSLRFIDSIFTQRDVKKIFGFGNSVVSFHVHGKGRLVPLLSVSVPPEMRQRHVSEILGIAGGRSIVESDYQGFSVFEIPVIRGKEATAVYAGFRQGSILCTPSRVLLETAIRHIDEESDIRTDATFARVYRAAGRNEDRLFVIFRNLPKFISSFTAGKGTAMAAAAGKVAGTAEGDVLISQNGLIVSGYIESDNPAQSLHRFRDTPAVSFDSYKILPVSTALFETSVFQAYRNPRQVSGTGRELLPLIASQILPFAGDEVTRALIDIRERPADENMILLYEIRNRDHVSGSLNAVLQASGSTKDEHIIWFTPDDQTRIAVYRAPAAGLHDLLVPGFAPGFSDLFYTFHDNFLITGSSYLTVSRVLYDNILNRTLANDMPYRDFEATLPSRASYYFYAVPSKITSFLSYYISSQGNKAISNNPAPISKVSAIGYHISPSSEMLYNSLSVRLISEAREESSSEWETLLDTTACIKPFFFTNHNTGAREIFVQDMSNNAYLINSTGRVLWKVPVRERINGTVYMIDYLRNGKFQLLFAGRDYLHLLDRNGNYVDRFPVKLRSPAAGPLSLFDYDNNKDYRLFVAGEDRYIYAYDKSGNVVRGWVPYRTQGLVRSEIKFFRISGKDYIVAGDESGMYFLDRRGAVRFTTREPVRKAVRSEIRLTTGSDPMFVCSSPEGEVQLVSLNGTVRKLSLQKFSPDHAFEYFDADGDGTGEFLFIDKGKLYLYDHNGNRVFMRDFSTGDLGGPIGFVFSGNDRGIGVVDNRNRQIYIVDNKGNIMGGFPLRGASLFSIGKITSTPGFNLIVGGTDNFLYNYRLTR